MDEDLRFTTAGPIATVELHRPHEQNRLTEAALRRLLAIADELAASAAAHVLVIRGAGGEWFSAGILNPALRAALGKEAVLDLVVLANRVFDAIEALPQIVIAGLNGMARAGAVELALACDLRIAAHHARLAMPEAQWGGFPGAGAPVRLPALVGRGRALELICTGREIDADEMARIGLVEHAVPSEAFERELARLAESIASSGPLAIRGAKRIVGLRGEPGFAASRALSDVLRRALEGSHDVEEGIAAHREGRRPNFRGR
jgi:enoyl-CoA hydratase